MRAVDFAGSNITMTKPENMTDEQCLPLKAYKGTSENVGQYFITAWKPWSVEILSML